jgi:hypothetical protein
VHHREIAFRSLDSGRNLYLVDISRFDLRLHEEMQDSVYLPADDAQKTYFFLEDDGLFHQAFATQLLLYSFDTEEPFALIHYRPGALVIVPLLAVLKSDPGYFDIVPDVLISNPLKDRLYGVQTIFGGPRPEQIAQQICHVLSLAM